MHTRALIVLPLLALCGCSMFGGGHTPRWNPNATARDENWHSPAAALLRYDANHDGTLTRAELMTGLKAEFDAFDVGHKNCLGPDQVRAINEMRVKEDASQATPLVDWNQDGCVDLNEYAGTTLSLFATLDANGDGEISPQEMGPPNRPAGAGGGGQGGGGRGGHGGGHHRGGGGQPAG